MKNVQTGMPMTLQTLDTMRVGCDDSIENGVNIPIVPTSRYEREYNSIYKAIEQTVEGHTKGDKNLDLHVIAKEGHSIYNYDGNYDYYYAAYIKNKEGKNYLARIKIELDEQEKKTIQNTIWRNRNSLKCARAQVMDVIKAHYGNDISFFCDGLYMRQYRSSWQNSNKDGLITAFIENIESGICPITIIPYGNIVQLG